MFARLSRVGLKPGIASTSQLVNSRAALAFLLTVSVRSSLFVGTGTGWCKSIEEEGM
jgi:hypothetical protein